jgi:Uma2 family endonuclease
MEALECYRICASTGINVELFCFRMTSILEIPEVRARVSRLSVEEYHRLGEFNDNHRRTELIRGVVIEKMSKSPLHRALCSRLYRFFSQNVPPGYSVWKKEPLTLRDSEPEPDLAVTLGDEAAFRDRHPGTAELVIEVAISSAALDRENASLYAEAGVKEYWIVLGDRQAIEVHRQPAGDRYLTHETVSAGEIVEPLPGVRFSVADLFRELSRHK